MLAAALSSSSWAVTASGRLTTSAYAYEGVDVDTSGASHLRVHQSVQLDLGDLGLPGLSVRTRLRGTTDVAEEAGSDPRLLVYSAYLSYRRGGQRLQIGRQWVHAGVGYGSLDGLRANVVWADVRLTAYAGALVPNGDTTSPNGMGDAHLVGVRLATERFYDTAISISFTDRERALESYRSPGRYSGLAGGSSAQRRLLGVDVGRRFGGHAVRGRLDYDLLAGSAGRAEISGRARLTEEASVEAEWRRREPSLASDSILSVFGGEPFQEIGARAHCQISADLRLSLHAATVRYDGDSSQRLGVTAGLGGNYTVGYYRSMGYAGANDGLVGSFYCPLSRKLVLRGQLDLASYERYEEAEERDGLVTGVLGATYRPSRAISLDLQVQGLRNPTHTSDLRVFARGSWRFWGKV